MKSSRQSRRFGIALLLLSILPLWGVEHFLRESYYTWQDSKKNQLIIGKYTLGISEPGEDGQPFFMYEYNVDGVTYQARGTYDDSLGVYFYHGGDPLLIRYDPRLPWVSRPAKKPSNAALWETAFMAALSLTLFLATIRPFVNEHCRHARQTKATPTPVD